MMTSAANAMRNAQLSKEASVFAKGGVMVLKFSNDFVEVLGSSFRCCSVVFAWCFLYRGQLKHLGKPLLNVLNKLPKSIGGVLLHQNHILIT